MNVVVKHGALALGQLGHHVDIYTRRTDPGLPATERHGTVELHHLDAGPARPADKTTQEEFVPEFAAALRRAHGDAVGRGTGWDLVHSHHWFSGAASLDLARASGLAHIQTFHSIAARQAGAWRLGEQAEGPGRVPAEALLAASSDAIISVSSAEAATVVDIGGDPRRITVVTPGVDLATFRPAMEQTRRHPRAGRSTVLVAARLEPLKGVDLAIELLARIPPPERPRLIISGAPTGGFPGYDHELHRLVQERSLTEDVWFAGPMRRAELAGAMREAELVLIPSHSETYGLVALEAAACGTPVIAARSGGLTDAVVDGHTGLLIDGREPAEWAGRVRELLRDAVGRRRMGATAAATAQGYTWGNMARQWLDAYREADPRGALLR